MRRVARVRGSRPGAPSHPPAGRVGGAAEGREDRQAQGWSRRQVRPRRAGPGAGGGARGFIVYGAGPLASSGLFCTVRWLRSLRHSQGPGRAGSSAGLGSGTGRRWFKMEMRAGAGRGGQAGARRAGTTGARPAPLPSPGSAGQRERGRRAGRSAGLDRRCADWSLRGTAWSLSEP